MTHQSWTIERILPLGICKDLAGHRALNANSYSAELSTETQHISVEVAVTNMASQYAMDCLRGESVSDKTDAKAIDMKLGLTCPPCLVQG